MYFIHPLQINQLNYYQIKAHTSHILCIKIKRKVKRQYIGKAAFEEQTEEHLNKLDVNMSALVEEVHPRVLGKLDKSISALFVKIFEKSRMKEKGPRGLQEDKYCNHL